MADVTKLVAPAGLSGNDDPLRAVLTGCIEELQNSLQSAESGPEPNYIRSAWAFRSVIDCISIITASLSVIPLSPSEAPLPGWRRSLWRGDFAEAAGGLLSWAASYLPRRVSQSNLARQILDFLYKDYNNGSCGESRDYVSLLGFSSSANFDNVPWDMWKDRFFRSGSLTEMRRVSKGVLNYLGHLNNLLAEFDKFLAPWRFEIAAGKSARKIIMRNNNTSAELPSFIVASRCSICNNDQAIYFFSAPCCGKRFLYREVLTGHELTLELDPLFKRRFFTNPLSHERNSVTSVTLDNAEANVIPLITEGFEELKARLLDNLGEHVFERWHLPVLATVCESNSELPFDILKTPGFGIRDGEYVSYRLNGLIAFGEDGRVELRSPQVYEYCQKSFAEQCRFANLRLAMWAEAVLQDEGSEFTPVQTFAVSHLAEWVKKSDDKEFSGRLALEGNFMPFVQRWCKELVSRGGIEDRNLALDISQGFLELFLTYPSKAANERVIEICRFRCDVFKQILDYVKAKEELDKAVVFISKNESNKVVRAEILGERAGLNLELDLPRLAADDAAAAAEIWSKLSDLGDGNALNNLANITCLRVKANLALGQRAQAVSCLQKLMDRKSNPRTEEEKLLWASLSLRLAELMKEQNTSIRQVRLRFEDVLYYTQDLSENSRVKELKAKALCGLADDKDTENAVAKLKEAEGYLKVLIDEKEDCRPAYAELVYRLAFLMEKCSRLDECLQYTEHAIGMYEKSVAFSDRFANRVSLAKLWLLRSRIEELQNNYTEAEKYINNSLDYYERLIDDSQVRYISDLAKVMAKRGYIRVLRKDYENAKSDLEIAIAKWPGAHDLKNAKAPLARVFLNLGVAYARLDNVSLALIQFEKALVIAKNRGDRNTSLQILSERVWTYFYDGQFKRAEDDFTNIFVSNQDEQNEKNLLGRGCARLRQDKFTMALADFSQVLIQYEDHSSPFAVMGAGISCLGSKDFDSAQVHFENLQKNLAVSDIDRTVALICNVVCHCGLGDVNYDKDREAGLTEYEKACQIWQHDSLGMDFGVDYSRLFDAMTVFFVDFVQMILRAAERLIGARRVDYLVSPLKMLRNFGMYPVVYSNLPNCGMQTGIALVKVFTVAKNGQESLKLTKEILREIKFGDLKKVGFESQEYGEAWLTYNVVSLLASVSEFRNGGFVAPDYTSLDEMCELADQAVSIYDRTSANEFDKIKKEEYAELQTIKAAIYCSLDRREAAKAAFERSKKLYSELRSSNGGRGFECEIGMIILNQMRNAAADENLTLFLFDELFNVLSGADGLKAEDSFRRLFTEELAERLSYAFKHLASCRDFACDIMKLPVWSADELITFENKFIAVLQNAFKRKYIALFRNIIKEQHRDDMLFEGRRPGGKFIELWLDTALRDEAAGGSEGLYMLEYLVRFGEEYGQLKGWPVNFAMKAQKCLADFYASEGNSRLAMSYLEKALNLVSDELSIAESSRLKAEIGVEQVELLIKDNKYEAAKDTLDRAELDLQKSNCGEDDKLAEKIKRIRVDLFLRGGLSKGSDKQTVGITEEEPSLYAPSADSSAENKSVSDIASAEAERKESPAEAAPSAVREQLSEEDVKSAFENVEFAKAADFDSQSEDSGTKRTGRRFIPDSIGSDNLTAAEIKPAEPAEPAVPAAEESAPAPDSEPAPVNTSKTDADDIKKTLREALLGGKVERNEALSAAKGGGAAAMGGAAKNPRSVSSDNVIASLRSRLNAKFNARKAEAASSARAEKSGGRIPVSESKKISLKGAVSDEHLEKLSQKAAQATLEQEQQAAAKKALPKKQIELPESLVDHMNKERQKKERQEIRKNSQSLAADVKSGEGEAKQSAPSLNLGQSPAAQSDSSRSESGQLSADSSSQNENKGVRAGGSTIASSAVAKLRAKLSQERSGGSKSMLNIEKTGGEKFSGSKSLSINNDKNKDVSIEGVANFASEVLGLGNDTLLVANKGTKNKINKLSIDRKPKDEVSAAGKAAERKKDSNDSGAADSAADKAADAGKSGAAPKKAIPRAKVALKSAGGDLITLKLRSRLNSGRADEAEKKAETPQTSESAEAMASAGALQTEAAPADSVPVSAAENAALAEQAAEAVSSSVGAEAQQAAGAEAENMPLRQETPAADVSSLNFEPENAASQSEQPSEPAAGVNGAAENNYDSAKAAEGASEAGGQPAAVNAGGEEAPVKGIAIKGTLSVRSMLRNLGSALGFSGTKEEPKTAEAPAADPSLEKTVASGDISQAAVGQPETKKPNSPEAPQADRFSVNSKPRSAEDMPAAAAVGDEPVNIINAGVALQEIDNGFARLDEGLLDQAERIFIRVGKAIPEIQQRDLGEVMAGLLEGFHGVACAMADSSMNKRAYDVALLASSLSRMYLSSRYDSAAWPWWGDVEAKSGECCALLKKYSDSCEHYRKAIEIYLKLIDLGVGEASRADALRTLVKLGKVLLSMNDIENALKNYNNAVDQGLIVLENGFDEELTMAEVYKARAEIYMMTGKCAEAVDDFGWAIEYYTRDTEKSRQRHLLEIAAVQVRMAEALFVIGKSDEAYHYRDELDRMANYFRKYKRVKEADIVGKYVKNLDSIATRYN